MRKFYPLLLFLFFLFLSAFLPPVPDEGMFPLSEIRDLDLKEAGLKINIDEVYNPGSTSLIDALVNIGGCTGSFVSPEGLILTNHHCSFGAVQKASTLGNNYIEDGFLAKNKSEEIPAAGITCRITVSYEDVSKQVLEAAERAGDISKRTDAITSEINEIVRAENAKDPSIVSQVSEMFTGQSYVLFRYKIINDVRLVYVPPRDIGEFGGESDNWVWPRHTGDFAFLRAYVAPDGSPASFSEKNIPFKPKKFLKVNPGGINENDFIFILGYPARTYKNQPSFFIEYQQKHQLPFLQELYSWMIELYEKAGEKDPEFALKISSKIKSLANSEKNYRGKLEGLERMNLINQKREEEKELQNFINNNPELKNKYGSVIPETRQVYEKLFEYGRLPSVISQLKQQVTYYRLAKLLIENDKHNSSERTDSIITGSEKLYNSALKLYNDLYGDIDRQIFTKILWEASQYPESQSIADPEGINDLNSFTQKLYNNTVISDKKRFKELIQIGSLKNINDPFIDFVKNVEKTDEEYNKDNSVLNSKLNLLMAKFLDVKRIWKDREFVPDANRTLRLTYGYVKGYSPADAVYYSPITTLTGLIEKGTDRGDFKINKKLVELYKKRDFGKFKDEKLNDVPVAVLYNTDTSGGNSGSPVLDAWGNLVALNFDRSFEATINDYVWNENYSRSIGVDIRYVLWVTEKIGDAGYLLHELGVY